jgi:hypothetical protein
MKEAEVRQLLVQVPRGHGSAVLDIATEHQGLNVAVFEASGTDGLLAVAIVHVSNARVDGLLDALQALPDVRVTLLPRGVITLHPPPSAAPRQVTDVTHRSPVEIYLAGLQSVGSWRGFLGYAAAAGVVVWVGLDTKTVYLLTAAMLIAPFAGPAMNVALAAARGDILLLARGLVRYIAQLVVAIVIAGALSLALRQGAVTAQMVATANVSVVAVLLPLVAGAAGALTLVQSERNSLVSGTAVGVLVAASLVLPAAQHGRKHGRPGQTFAQRDPAGAAPRGCHCATAVAAMPPSHRPLINGVYKTTMMAALLLWAHGGRDARPAQTLNGDQARSRKPRCREGAASATIPSVRPLTRPS